MSGSAHSDSGGATLPWEILKSDEPGTGPGPVGPASQPMPRPSPWPDLTWLFLVLAGGLAGGLTLAGGMPFTVNDASRWNTVYYLVEHGTYRYKLNHGAAWKDYRSYDVDPQTVPEAERGSLIAITDDGITKYYRPTGSPPRVGDLLYFPVFPTIDMVKLGDNYYSSKPPLLPTILAGIAWTAEKATGFDFRTKPWAIIRMTLLVAQVLPLLIFIWVVGRYVRGVTALGWVHAFCMAAAALGTYLTPWVVTLNNHVIAAFTAMFAIHAAVRIWYDDCRSWYWFVLAGFFGALTAAIELPAALLAAGILLALMVRDAKRTLMFAVGPALAPVIAFLLTNYLATGQWTPVYAEFGKPGGGYDYPGSYWNNPVGMDALREPNHVYLMHVLVGHHGFFLLTPILVLSLLGIFSQLSRRTGTRPLLGLFVLAATAIVVCFYTFYTSESKNYGGTAQGPRWLFWLIPLWLTMLPPGVELLSRWRVARGVCYVLLLISALSAGFALRQPWSASWAHLLFHELGWISY